MTENSEAKMNGRPLLLGFVALWVALLPGNALLMSIPVGDSLPRWVLRLLPLKLSSARAGTESTMWVLKRRILQYARDRQTLPASLADLPPLAGFDNGIRDA
jgi:hypothetical protein